MAIGGEQTILASLVDAFSRSFFIRLLPTVVGREMEQSIINLRQARKIVEKYALTFNCLSQFAPYMILDVVDFVHHFQQGLRLDI